MCTVQGLLRYAVALPAESEAAGYKAQQTETCSLCGRRNWRHAVCAGGRVAQQKGVRWGKVARWVVPGLGLLLLFGSLDCCLLNFIKPFQNANERTHKLPR